MDITIINGKDYYEPGSEISCTLLESEVEILHNVILQSARQLSNIEGGNKIFVRIPARGYEIYGRSYCLAGNYIQAVIVENKLYPLLRKAKDSERRLLQTRELGKWYGKEVKQWLKIE